MRYKTDKEGWRLEIEALQNTGSLLDFWNELEGDLTDVDEIVDEVI